jgi:hypothetical protein
MLGSYFSPNGSGVNEFPILYNAALVTGMNKRLLNILNAMHMAKLTAAVAH